MAKNLKLGSRFIRLALICGFFISIVGIYSARLIVVDPSAGLTTHGQANVAVIAFALNALILLIVFWMLMARKMVKRVQVMAAAMNRGAEGDLTAKVAVDSVDELDMLGSTFNGMLEKLAGMAERVNVSIRALRRISGDIKEVSQRGVSAAEIQSEAVEGTSGAVQEISRSINEVAQSVGNLARSATDNASSILEMSASIEEVIKYVEALAEAVDEVSSSMIEMAAAERQIGASVNNLMADSTTTTRLVAEMAGSIKQVEQNALNTASISEEVRNDAESGRESVEATISGIGEIRRSSRITFEAIENLSSRAGNIGKILSVIGELAEQTNLLALNASIIAAQAGVHGKGFAVVAEEIKDLARRTGSSTRDITDIIKGVQEETQRAVKAIKVSEQRIAEGEQLSQRSGEALNKIVAGVQMATDQVNQIARTTVEQAGGSQEIRKAMEREANMVGQIARATREQAHGSELIMAAVERMKGLTGQVKGSTREQSSSSNLIVRSTEDIAAMIKNIRQACAVQTDGSRMIVEAIEHIEQSTQTNAEVTRVMDSAVEGLSRQIEVLRNEMSGFKT
jgi:methyl-accepting chemotaxis protein